MKRYTLYLLVLSLILLCGCTGAVSSREYSETMLMMDTVCTIRAGGSRAEEAVSAAFACIEGFSAKVDYFSEESEVSAVNRAAGGEEVFLSDDVFVVISKALEIGKASGGAFDITTAPLKDLWDVGGGAHKPPEGKDIGKALNSVGYEKLALDKEKNSITKTADDVKIDLGGAAKGYAADCAIEVLKRNGAEYALVDLGGNIATFGKNPARDDGNWVIGIQKPFSQSGEYEQTVPVQDCSVVTAGIYQRYFEWDGEMYHHIIDPKTGYPSRSGASGVSIVAKSALVADCLATACVVLGVEDGIKLAQEFGVELIVN